MAATLGGRAAANASTENGRYRRTVRTPTRSPVETSESTVVRAVCAPDPMRTITRSGYG